LRNTLLSVILLISLSLSSCFCTKKTRTVTETIIDVDTVIIIQRDTSIFTNTVFLYDTTFIETSGAIATSYYDTVYKTIVLKLQEKPFDYRVTLKATEKKKEVIRQPVMSTFKRKAAGILLFIGLSVIVLYIFKKLINEKTNDDKCHGSKT
jgi:hypothetical protein